VLKDYADQKEAVGYARTRLTAMRRSSVEPGEPTIQARRLLAGRYGEEVTPEHAPCPVSDFIGGDIVADILACGMAGREEVSLMIDIGTNFEVVLGNRDWMIAAS
jgi:hypothetical protein